MKTLFSPFSFPHIPQVIWQQSGAEKTSETVDNILGEKTSRGIADLGTNIEKDKLKEEVTGTAPDTIPETAEAAEVKMVTGWLEEWFGKVGAEANIEKLKNIDFESMTPKDASALFEEKIQAIMGEDSALGEFWEESKLNKHLDRVSAQKTWQEAMGKLFDENNAKVAAITATLGWMDTKGGTKARLAGAIKWGLVGAILTQPTLTNTVSDLARAAGNTIGVGASVMAPELVIRMIDDPGSFFKAIEKSKQDKNASSVYDILRHGSDVPEQQRETLLEDKDIFRLREEFPLDPKLNSVIDAILLYQKQEAVFDTPPTFPADELQKAAEFVVKAEEEIQLSDKEFDDRLRRINEGKGTLSDQFAPNEIKQMIATSAYNEIMVFFLHEDRPEALQQEFEKQFSLALAKKQNGEMETLDLETDVLDETKISNEDLQDLNTKEKTGIRRILGMGLTKNALLVTVLTFLLTSGIVKLRGIIQRDWWKEKGEKVKKFSLLPFKSLDSLKNNFKRFKRKIKKWGKKKFGWSDEQVKTFEGLKASQKKDVKKKFFSIADDKKAKYEERKKAAPKGEKPKKREELEFTKDEFNQLFSSLPEEKRILLQVSD